MRSGLEVLANELEFDGQYIVLEARAHRGGEILVEAGERVRLAVGHFEATAPGKVAEWRAWLDEHERVALWGGSSKAVGFLTATGASAEVAVVDVNPYRQGAFLPGGGQRVLAPEELRRDAARGRARDESRVRRGDRAHGGRARDQLSRRGGRVSLLVVVAHPDDEVLGTAGVIATAVRARPPGDGRDRDRRRRVDGA